MGAQPKGKSWLDSISDISEQKPDSALFLLNNAIKNQSLDSIHLPKIKNIYSQIYSMKGDYSLSDKYAFEAIFWSNKYKDTSGLIDANNNLGINYMYKEEYKKSIGYLRQVEELSKRSKDSLRLGHAYNNLGISTGYLGDSHQELAYYEKAADLFLKIDEKEGYANTLLNKATVYTLFKDYDKAEKLFVEAMQIYQQLGFLNAINMTFQSMAENALEASKPRKALQFAKEALSMSRKNGYKTEEASALKIISKIYSSIQRFDSAFAYLELHIAVRNEIFNTEKDKISSELEKKYNTELKEEKIRELEQLNTIKNLEKAQAEQRSWLLFGLVLLVVAVATGLFFLYNQKKKNAALLDKKNMELEQLNRFKDRMFAVISHDLRNPMNAFHIIIQSLNKNLEHASREEIKEFLDSTLQSATELKNLLNNLLEWAMVQIGKMPFQAQKIPLSRLVEEAINHVGTHLKQKNIEIKFSPAQTAVWGDYSMLLIVLRNILSNAIKFSPEGSSIELTTTQNKEYVVLTIKDQGIGMSPDDLKKLFNPNSDKMKIGNSQHKGSGIGLMLCVELLHKNNGEIWAESQLGVGSTFFIKFKI